MVQLVAQVDRRTIDGVAAVLEADDAVPDLQQQHQRTPVLRDTAESVGLRRGERVHHNRQRRRFDGVLGRDAGLADKHRLQENTKPFQGSRLVGRDGRQSRVLQRLASDGRHDACAGNIAVVYRFGSNLV